jgi:hypothetical protein
MEKIETNVAPETLEATAPETKPENTGEATAPETLEAKIERLKAVAIEAEKASRAFDDIFSEPYKAAKLAASKAMGAYMAAIGEAEKLENEAKLNEQKNARIALFDNAIEAYQAMTEAENEADKASLSVAFETARELVVNELLAKFGASPKKATSGEAGKATAPKASENGTTEKARIVADWLASDMKLTNKQLIEMGYSRSTVFHALNDYKRDNKIGKFATA